MYETQGTLAIAEGDKATPTFQISMLIAPGGYDRLTAEEHTRMLRAALDAAIGTVPDRFQTVKLAVVTENTAVTTVR
ncbi:hypothetical protein [Streptomyces abikoensis]|uniref:Uncharacterized protein n=1 Tax=Streptomyces abikoensis TaxID=97398 RepID=A0ABW7T6R1_9ACTN